MGCFLTNTERDLEQLRQRMQTAHGTASPMTAPSLVQQLKDDIGNVSEFIFEVGLENLEAASRACGFDEINSVFLQFEDAVEDRTMTKTDAAKECNSIASDATKAAKVKGATGSNTSPLYQLGAYDVGSNEWRGARFELRFAALRSHEIEEVDCPNYVDARLKDGTYCELKSFTQFGGTQRDNILSQVKKDIDPRDRGIGNLKIVLDGTYATPSQAFLEQLQQNADALKVEVNNPNAVISCEVIARDGSTIRAF